MSLFWQMGTWNGRRARRNRFTGEIQYEVNSFNKKGSYWQSLKHMQYAWINWQPTNDTP
jgi:hypothetical protein